MHSWPYLYFQNCLTVHFATAAKDDPGKRNSSLLQSSILQTSQKRPKAPNFESQWISSMLAMKWSHHFLLPSQIQVSVLIHRSFVGNIFRVIKPQTFQKMLIYVKILCNFSRPKYPFTSSVSEHPYLKSLLINTLNFGQGYGIAFHLSEKETTC